MRSCAANHFDQSELQARRLALKNPISGAFGNEPEMPQLLADALDRDILVVDESHLPAVGAAAMCAEVLDGQIVRRQRPAEWVPEWNGVRPSPNAGNSTGTCGRLLPESHP
jgi:sugar (pentulose or hexulose) kinase